MYMYIQTRCRRSNSVTTHLNTRWLILSIPSSLLLLLLLLQTQTFDSNGHTHSWPLRP